MASSELSILVRSCWFQGNLEEKFLLYGNAVLRFPSSKLVIRGYWSETPPHYLLGASYDIAYVKPASVQEDSNLLLTVVSRDNSLNQRVLSEFSAKTGICGFMKPGIDVKEAVSRGQSEVYLGLEREGLAFLGVF